MKKYIYIVALIIVCLTTCNVTLAATSLKDISGTKYEDAVESLVEIGLVNGYPEDNTYRPSVAVTRAQMAKMMVIALGEEGKVENASKKASTFTDIKSGHWAYGYVNVAKELGIINGYPDGRFGPEDTVTYAEASTMALRALGYEDEIAKSTESWPNNYISYGKKLSLYNSVGTFDSGKGAARGDIALILWNMLRTGVCAVTGQNNSGLIYGQGERMLNKYKDYIYEDDAFITSVKFEDDYSEADVTITRDETIKVTLDDSEVLECYGRKLEVLYDAEAKEIIYMYDSKKYTEKDGIVTDTSRTYIYLDDDDYALPSDSNILLYKTEKLSDAVEATLFMSGSTVKYILASGAKNVYIGLVTQNNIEVDEEDGIKIKKLGSNSETSYVLIDSDDMPAEDKVIIYYLNSDNELGILKEIDVDDAKSISSRTSSQIKVGSTTYNYSSSTFTVVTATSSKVSSMTYSNIDKSEDLAYVYEYAGKTYLIVFENSVEDADAKEDALEELKKYINDYNYLMSKEASYSQSTFTRFYNAMTTAKGITSSSRLVKINEALTELKEAKNALKTVSSFSTEGRIASCRASLRNLVTTGDTVVKNQAQYTTSSYNAFYSKYVLAKDLLEETNNTYDEVKKMYDELNSLMSSSKLIKITTTQEHKDALARLKTAVDTYGNAGPEASYTTDSYSKYKTAKANATNARDNNAAVTHTKLDEYAKALEDAYRNLKLAIESLKADLDEKILDCMVYEDYSGDYMPLTYSAYKTAMDNAIKARKSTVLSEVQTALDNLVKAVDDLREIEDELDDLMIKIDAMKNAPAMSTAINPSHPDYSTDKLNRIYNIRRAVKTDLSNLIEEALRVSLSVSGDTRVVLLDATSEAETALNNGSKVNVEALSNETVKVMVDAFVKLEALVPKQNLL